MSNIVTLKSFPFDSMKVLNEESNQMEDDRLYQAEIFRNYFAKFLSNGVYLGNYKNYGENSMKVVLDTGLTVKVNKGCGIINGADYELESDTLFSLERPTAGERKDRVVVKVDDTLAVRETQLYIKAGTGTIPAALQRDNNIYEICIAEITVKSTSNLTETDIVDTRENKELCGIVNGLLIVNKGDFLQKTEAQEEYINKREAQEKYVDKNEDNVLEGKITVKNGIESNKKIIAKGGVEGTCSQVQTVTVTGAIRTQ